MKISTIIVTWSVLALVASTGCATDRKKTLERAQADNPVDCRTAEAEIRVLQSEKAHVAEQIAMGVTAIVPVGLVLGLLTGTEGTKIEVAIGEYDKKLDARIAQIKTTCGIE